MSIIAQKLNENLDSTDARERAKREEEVRRYEAQRAEKERREIADANAVLAEVVVEIEQALGRLKKAGYPHGYVDRDPQHLDSIEERGLAPRRGAHLGHFRQFQFTRTKEIAPNFFRKTPKLVQESFAQELPCWMLGRVSAGGEPSGNYRSFAEWVRVLLVPDTGGLYLIRESHVIHERAHTRWPTLFDPETVEVTLDSSWRSRHRIERNDWTLAQLQHLLKLLKEFKPASWKK